MDFNPYRAELAEAEARRDSIYAEINQLHTLPLHHLSAAHGNRVQVLLDDMHAAHEQCAALRRKALDYDIQQLEELQRRYEAEAKLYRRPMTGWLARPLNRMLGPLPAGMEKVQPTKEALAALPSYRGLALLTVVGAIAFTMGLIEVFPILRTSPYSLMTDLFGFMGSFASVSAMLVCIVLAFTGVGRGTLIQKGRLLDRFAAYEEHWFRSGAENWNPLQRLGSCIAFGLAHVINMIYPAAVLPALMAVGAVYLAVYLRAYRQSNDTYWATMVASKFHATYNRIVLALVGIVLAVKVLNLFL